MTDSRPWLADDRWSGGIARSDGTRQLIIHWLSAVVWNLFTAAILYATWRDGWSSFPVLLRVLLVAFMAVGIPLAYSAVVQTFRHTRFKDIRLVLDPFPGSIGGQAGGTVDIPVRAGTTMNARATLHCIHSYVRGSGDDRSRREDVVWSAQTIPSSERSGTGVRLAFTFDIPDVPLPESEAPDERDAEDHHYWSVHLAAELPGADLDQAFRVPVYRTDPAMVAARPAPPTPAQPDLSAGRGVNVERRAEGAQITYRRGRYGFAPLGFLAFGLVTIVSGSLVFSQTAIEGGFAVFGLAFGGLFLVVFGLVGLLCVGLALAMLLSHRVVDLTEDAVRSTRSYGFGRFVREARLDDIARIEATVTMQSGQGSHARTGYTIAARPRSGGRVVLGDGIQGAYLLDQLRTVIEDETGIGVEVVRRG